MFELQAVNHDVLDLGDGFPHDLNTTPSHLASLLSARTQALIKCGGEKRIPHSIEPGYEAKCVCVQAQIPPLES